MKKHHSKKIFLILLTVLVVTFSISAYITIESFNEEKLNKYSYTTAICNDKICQDYFIECNGSEVITKTQITGAFINIPKNWNDPRPQELTEKFCSFSLN